MSMSAFNEAWFMLKGWQDEETSMHDELDPSRPKRESKQFEQDVPPYPDYDNMAPQELQIELDDIIDQITNLEQQKHDIELALHSLSAEEDVKPQTAGGATMGADTDYTDPDIISRLVAQGKLPKGFKLG
jgi:hypothetical protein